MFHFVLLFFVIDNIIVIIFLLFCICICDGDMRKKLPQNRF